MSSLSKIIDTPFLFVKIPPHPVSHIFFPSPRIQIWSLAASRQSSWPSMAISVWSLGTDPRRASPSKRNTTCFYAEGRQCGCAWNGGYPQFMVILTAILWWFWLGNYDNHWNWGLPSFQTSPFSHATQCLTPRSRQQGFRTFWKVWKNWKRRTAEIQVVEGC